MAAHGLSLIAVSGSYPLVVGHRLSFRCGASLVVAHGLQCAGSAIVPRSLAASRHVESSLVLRNRTCVPCIGKWVLNYWATREVLHLYLCTFIYICVSIYINTHILDISPRNKGDYFHHWAHSVNWHKSKCLRSNSYPSGIMWMIKGRDLILSFSFQISSCIKENIFLNHRCRWEEWVTSWCPLFDKSSPLAASSVLLGTSFHLSFTE